MLAGVCGGIGEYFNVDPVIIRIIAVILLFMGGSGILAYIIGMIIIPENPELAAPEKPQQWQEPMENTGSALQDPGIQQVQKSGDTGALIVGLVLVLIGGIFLMRNLPYLNHYYWWVKDQIRDFFWPAILIGFGMFMIVKSTRK